MERFAVPFAKALLFRPGTEEFLLQQRVKPGDIYFGLWEVPGGRVRDGETLLDGLAREVREESGIERIRWLGQDQELERDRFGGRVRSLHPLVTVEILHGSGPVFGHYFVGETDDLPRDSEEAKGHRWIDPEGFRREFLLRPMEERDCTTVDSLALRLALEGPLVELLSGR